MVVQGSPVARHELRILQESICLHCRCSDNKTCFVCLFRAEGDVISIIRFQSTLLGDSEAPTDTDGLVNSSFENSAYTAQDEVHIYSTSVKLGENDENFGRISSKYNCFSVLIFIARCLHC